MGFLIHDTFVYNPGRKEQCCCPMFHRYLKWDLSRKGKVSNECRNVPGNDGSIEETALQGIINLGDMTKFLSLSHSLGHTRFGKPTQRTIDRVWVHWNSAQSATTIMTWLRQPVPGVRLPSLTNRNKSAPLHRI